MNCSILRNVLCILAGVIEDDDDVSGNDDQNDAVVDHSDIVDQASDMKDDAIGCFKSHTGLLRGTTWL